MSDAARTKALFAAEQICRSSLVARRSSLARPEPLHALSGPTDRFLHWQRLPQIAILVRRYPHMAGGCVLDHRYLLQCERRRARGVRWQTGPPGDDRNWELESARTKTRHLTAVTNAVRAGGLLLRDRQV